MRKYYLAVNYYYNLHWIENGIYCELLKSGNVHIHSNLNNQVNLVPFDYDIWRANSSYRVIALNIIKSDIIEKCIFESVKEST